MIEIEISPKAAEKSGLLEKSIYNYSREDISICGRVIKDESKTTWLAYEDGLKLKRGNLTAKLLEQSDSIILIDQMTYDHLSSVGLPVNIKSPRMLILEVMQLHIDEMQESLDRSDTPIYTDLASCMKMPLSPSSEYTIDSGELVKAWADIGMGPDFDDPRAIEVDDGDVDILTHFKIVEHTTTGYTRIRKDFKTKYGMSLTDRDLDSAYRYIDSCTSLNMLSAIIHDIHQRDRYFKHILRQLKESRR